MKLGKRKILIFILLFSICIISMVILKYSRNNVVYANTSDVEISRASSIDIEEIIKKNNKISSERIITEEINLEYITQYKNSNELPKGTIQVIQEGRTGKQQITKKITIDENGEEKIEELSSITIVSPADKIIEVGTSLSKKSYKISKGSEVYITSDSAEIRAEDNEQSKKITTLFRNTKLKIMEIKNNWGKIFTNNQYGWLKLETVAIIYAN